MSLVWIEGFESFHTLSGNNIGENLLRKYPSIFGSPWTSETGKVFGGLSSCSNVFNAYINTPIFQDSADWIVGFGYKPNTLSATSRNLLKFREDDTLTHITIFMNSSGGGTIGIGRADGTPVIASTTQSWTVGTWVYIEVRVRISDASGQYEIKVDENVVLSGTSDTRNGGRGQVNNFQIGIASGGCVDDIYILDQNTGTENIDFLGVSTVKGLVPVTTVVGSTDWAVTGAASHHLAVSEVPADLDTSYIDTNTTDATDLYTVGSSLSGISDVYGLQVNMLARKDDHGSRIIKSIIRSDPNGTPTEEIGDDKHLNDTYLYHTQISELDPDTGSSWTLDAIENSQFGINLGG